MEFVELPSFRGSTPRVGVTQAPGGAARHPHVRRVRVPAKTGASLGSPLEGRNRRILAPGPTTAAAPAPGACSRPATPTAKIIMAWHVTDVVSEIYTSDDRVRRLPGFGRTASDAHGHHRAIWPSLQ